MLLFYPTSSGLDHATSSQSGRSPSDQKGIRLYTSLDAAKEATSGEVFVVDRTELERVTQTGPNTVEVSSLPSTAIKNVSPYRPPVSVAAAGGYVACPLPEDIAVLLIYRRGVWDVPKGKVDPGEDLESCATREVSEEVGIEVLDLLRTLGTTQHGYVDGDAYVVKTTHWYLMQTPERSFEPERGEGIRRVSCARWAIARRHIGYETLRRHMDRIESVVRQVIT